MSWKIGNEVVVRTLGNRRGVVVDAGRNGRYKVRVEGVTTSCREEDLAAPAESKGKKKSSAAPSRPERPRASGKAETSPASRVDLHGLSVEEALATVMDEIDRALRRGADRLEVVHGKGTGRIKQALHQRLASLSVVAAFKIDQHNSGITWVYF
jgi:DNA mismatch repair protein MutS2